MTKSKEQPSEKNTNNKAAIVAEEKDKKFDKEDHYFKLNARILDIASTKDLSKMETLIYAAHNRCRNPKGRFQGCSIAGKNFVYKKMGINNDGLIERATNRLITKHFIEKRSDVKPWIYKTKAIEVLPFPEYTPPAEGESTGSFSPGTRNKPEKIIQIPSSLIDDGILNDGLIRQEIFCLFYLYSIIDWQKYRGVNYNLIHFESEDGVGFMHNGTFPEGVHPSLFKKDRLFVTEDSSCLVTDAQINFIQGNLSNCIETLLKKNIFIKIPILVEIDEEESELLTIKKEIFKNLMSFKWENNRDYWFDAENIERKKIIWVLQPSPKYCVINKSYEEYQKQRDKVFNNLKKMYSHSYFETSPTEQANLLNPPEFLTWFISNYRELYFSLLKKYPWMGDLWKPLALGYDDYANKECIRNHVLSKLPMDVILQYHKHVASSKP